MKALIFIGLVLGSATYLVATQSDLLHGWIEGVKPQAQNVVSEGHDQLDQLFDRTVVASKELTESRLVSDMKRTLSELAGEVEHLKQELKQAKAEGSKKPYTTGKNDGLKVNWGAGEIVLAKQNLADQSTSTLVSHSISNSAFMSAKERSDALMALARRMEMKAASF